MKKQNRVLYVCQACGYQAPKWMGRCPDCNEWGTLVEERVASPHAGNPLAGEGAGMRPVSLDRISLDREQRWQSGTAEFDRTLGGGLVPGSMILVGGEPGIGKSTMLLQVAGRFSLQGLVCFYLSGEESSQQIRLRADRLSITSDKLYVATGTLLEDLAKTLKELNPDILIVDSIQTLQTDTLPSAPGSVGQVREVSARLMSWAKDSGTPTFLVGHVTKDGAIAGPKVLEHMVDTVLYFEGDRSHAFRILRSVKNRYGPTNEIGVFEMTETGLTEVANPSRIFLEERPRGASGSVVIPCLEGTRPVLVEIQALVGPSPLGVPRRTAIGVDPNRVSLLVAVIGKRMGMEMGGQDIFVNVAGGLRVDEPAADLGIVAALVSSYLDKPAPLDMAAFGEVGLAGEVRGVSQPEIRVREARKLGFSRCLLSRGNMSGVGSVEGISALGIESVAQLPELLWRAGTPRGV
jgi:DNA repair protein RadA/Sms